MNDSPKGGLFWDLWRIKPTNEYSVFIATQASKAHDVRVNSVQCVKMYDVMPQFLKHRHLFIEWVVF